MFAGSDFDLDEAIARATSPVDAALLEGLPQRVGFGFATANGDAIPSGLPGNVQVVRRPEGTLLTTDSAKATAFKGKDTLTDAEMARLLGYPQAKPDALRSPDAKVVQARDANGAVVKEALVSPDQVDRTRSAFAADAPEGGSVVAVTPDEAQARRTRLRTAETR